MQVTVTKSYKGTASTAIGINTPYHAPALGPNASAGM